MAEKVQVLGKGDVEAQEYELEPLKSEETQAQEPDAAAGQGAPQVAPASPQQGQQEAGSMLHMKALSLFVLTGSQALLPLQVAWTRRKNVEAGVPLYLNTSVVVGAEAIKFCISFMLLCSEESFGGATAAVRTKFCVERTDTLKVAVPGFLYTIQAALVYYAMDNLSPPIFQVTYQLKILTTALLSVVMLSKPLGGLKWFALFLLTIGAGMVQVGNADSAKSSSQEKDMSAAVVGLVALLCACFTSGLAGVWLEKMLKQTKASIWMRNVQLAFFGFIIAVITAYVKDGPKIMKYGMFGGFGWREQLLTLHQGVTGLASAAVLKYADNILKCFAGVAAILIVSVGTAISSPETFELDIMFVCGSGIVTMAICLYNLGCPTCATDMYEQVVQSVEPSNNADLPASASAKVS